MEIINSPNPIDEPNLIYKLQRKIKIFNESDLPNRGYNLVATSSKYGLVFIGIPTSGFSVYYLRDVVNADCAAPPHMSLALPEPPTHLAVGCDQELLAVATTQHIFFYNAVNFQNENNSPVSVRCSEDPRVRVSAVQWNPCQPDTLAAALADGSLLVCQVKGADVATKKIAAKARCLCWSPKGKQLVTGNADGTLCQYKPDLTPVKSVPAPGICGGSPVEVLAVQWISNYQFGVVYRNSADDSRPYVTVVNTPKAGPMVCISYEDICYSMGSSRPWYYYLHSVAQWGILMAASSNSVEVATLGSSDSTNWVQWCQMDEAKPELPLTDLKQDNYPVGLAFDTAAIHRLPWGENETLPHMPSLLVLSHTGLLVVFNVVNLGPGAPQLCEPPLPIVLPPHLLLTEALETAEAPRPPAAAPVPPAAAPPVETATQSQPPSGLFASPSSGFATAQSSPAPLGQTQQSVPFNQGEPKPPPDLVPQPQSKPQPAVQPAAAPRSQPPAESPPPGKAGAAHRSAELRAASARASEEMTSVLVELVNGFQAELHEFLRRARDVDMQLNMGEARALSEQLRETSAASVERECSLESLGAAVVEMKLDVVKTCALLADARSEPGSGAEARRRVEPACARSLESVRRRLQAVQAALLQAERIVHHKWGEVYARIHRGGRRGRGEYMATPALDAVYQPLVKQQEILTRQQAAVRALRAALQDASGGPAGTLLKGFDKDPLSALSRGVLAMRLERGAAGDVQGGAAGAGGKLSAHKLEALRDMLVNHKTTRVKPFNIVMERHLASMAAAHERLQRESRERSAEVALHREQAEGAREPVGQNGALTKQEKPTPKPAPLQNLEPINRNVAPPAPKDVHRVTPGTKQPPAAIVQEWPNGAPASQANVLNWAQKPSVAGSGNTVTITASNIASVARNLFANNEAPKFENKPSTTADIAPPKPTTDKNIPTSNAGSIIVGLLQNKTNQQLRNNPNMFMGQKICSPTTVTTSAATPFGGSTFSAFAPKPSVATSVAASKSPFGGDSKPFAFFSNQAKSSELPSAGAGQKSSELAKALADAKSVETDGSEKTEGTASQVSKNGTPKEPQTEGELAGDKSTLESSMKPEGVKSLTEAKEQNAEPKQPSSEKGSALSTSQNFLTTDTKPFSFLSADAKAPTSPTGSIFAMPPSPNAIIGSIFGGSSATQSSKDSAPTSAASVFASPPPSSGTSSIFGSPTPPVATPPSSAAVSPFGVANKSAVDQGTPNANGVAPSPVSAAASLFAGPNAAVSVTSATPFSSSAGSIFGVPASSSAPLFGATSPVTTTVSSIFGATTSVATTVSPVFGPTTPVVTTVSSVFGATTPVATTVSSVFGATTPVATTVSSLFGATTPAATAVSSVFGATTPVVTTVTSVFGATSPAASSPASVFGASPVASTPASVFGASAVASTPASVFGAAPPAASTATSVFGATTTDVSNQGLGNIFGSQHFGKPAVQPSQSVFASSDPSSLFGAVSISTTNASPASPGNIFANSSGGSVFGGGMFGAKPAFAAPAAGGAGPAGAQSVFGGGAFGQQPAAVFGAPSFGTGSPSQTTQASSIFGGGGGFSSGATSFGAAPAGPASIFGTPETLKAASVFGSPQQNAPAFGGGAVFGSKPVFGQSTGFSSPGGGGFASAFSGAGGGGVAGAGAAAGAGGFGAPAFGGKSPGGFGAAPVFGGGAFGSTSPSKIFGGGSPGFGAPMQQSSTFENLAGQNTLSFGNLAQQSPPQHQPPAFNTSPSFSGWRG